MNEKMDYIFEELMNQIDTCKERGELDTARDLIRISSRLSRVKYELFKQLLELDIELQ